MNLLTTDRNSDFYDQLNMLNYGVLASMLGDAARFSCLEPVCKNQDRVTEKRKAILVDRLINLFSLDITNTITACDCERLVASSCCGTEFETLYAASQELTVTAEVGGGRDAAGGSATGSRQGPGRAAASAGAAGAHLPAAATGGGRQRA